MLRVRGAVRVLSTLVLGTVVVAAPVPVNLAALILWAFLVVGWVKRRAGEGGRRAGTVELATQFVSMSVLVLAAASAPVKVVDRVKARRVLLPKQAMTIGELKESQAYESTRRFRYGMSAPDDMAGRVVRFPSRGLTVGEFIDAIEAQTPLRHRFGHCGNGSTILWGGDCSFGLSFSPPPR
jgi:hypothetical protein